MNTKVYIKRPLLVIVKTYTFTYYSKNVSTIRDHMIPPYNKNRKNLMAYNSFFIVLHGVKKLFKFILLYVTVQMSQHHSLKCLFSQLDCLGTPVKKGPSQWVISGLSVLLQWPVCLSWCQQHTVFTVGLDIRPKTMKLIEENIEINFCDLWIRQSLDRCDIKMISNNKKLDIFSKTKNICATMDTSRKRKCNA